MYIKGVQPRVVDAVDGETMNLLWQAKGVIYVVQLEECKNKEEDNIHEDLQAILEKFLIVFEVPKESSPARCLDHRIPLIDHNKAVCAKPYIYPYHQK